MELSLFRGGSELKSGDFHLGTKLVEEVYSFGWDIDNYTSISNIIRHSELRSPISIGGPKSKHSWQLKLYPKMIEANDNKEYLTILLALTDFGAGAQPSSGSVRARFQLSILNDDGNPRKQFGHYEKNATEFKKYTERGWNQVILSKNVRDYLVNGSLKLRCKIWIEGKVEYSVGVEGDDVYPLLSEEEMDVQGALALADDFRQLSKDESNQADVIIQTATGISKFRAHKALLIARSPVFAKMFGTPMREQRENTVVIKQYDDETVKGMLQWMYTGYTEILEKRALDLLQIAGHYDLKELKGKCEKVIGSKLCVENVAKILVLATLHNAPLLKQQAIELFVSKKDEVVKTPGFKEVVEKYQRTGVFVELLLSLPAPDSST